MLVRQPIPFGQHSVAVLSAAMLGSTLVALILTSWLAIGAIQRPMSSAWLATMAIAIWVGVFMVALPGAAIILSVLWPVTRRRTGASTAICVIAGATGGTILAPLASNKMHGVSAGQTLLFASVGAAVALIYIVIAARLGRGPASSLSAETLRSAESDQLELKL